jgi:hypothetical protein
MRRRVERKGKGASDLDDLLRSQDDHLVAESLHLASQSRDELVLISGSQLRHQVHLHLEDLQEVQEVEAGDLTKHRGFQIVLKHQIMFAIFHLAMQLQHSSLQSLQRNHRLLGGIEVQGFQIKEQESLLVDISVAKALDLFLQLQGSLGFEADYDKALNLSELEVEISYGVRVLRSGGEIRSRQLSQSLCELLHSLFFLAIALCQLIERFLQLSLETRISI